MEVSKILSDQGASGVIPGPRTDAVAGIHRRLTGPRLRAEISVPRVIAGAGGHRELLAMSIGARQPSQITAVANWRAGDKECHGMLLRPLRRLLRQRKTATEPETGRADCSGDGQMLHIAFSSWDLRSE